VPRNARGSNKSTFCPRHLLVGEEACVECDACLAASLLRRRLGAFADAIEPGERSLNPWWAALLTSLTLG